MRDNRSRGLRNDVVRAEHAREVAQRECGDGAANVHDERDGRARDGCDGYCEHWSRRAAAHEHAQGLNGRASSERGARREARCGDDEHDSPAREQQSGRAKVVVATRSRLPALVQRCHRDHGRGAGSGRRGWRRGTLARDDRPHNGARAEHARARRVRLAHQHPARVGSNEHHDGRREQQGGASGGGALAGATAPRPPRRCSQRGPQRRKRDERRPHARLRTQP